MMKTPLWKYSYANMMTRCYNKKCEFYSIYGGRGITVCERWKGNPKQFYADMGDRVSGISLDRIDVNGNYEPSNCRWATASEQAQNRNDSIYVVYEGNRVHVHEAAYLSGLSVRTIKDRIRNQKLTGDALFAKQMSHVERTKLSGASRRLTAQIVCPTGETVVIDNIPDFCKKHQLGNGNFSKVLRGLSSHCKGFTGRYLEVA